MDETGTNNAPAPAPMTDPRRRRRPRLDRHRPLEILSVLVLYIFVIRGAASAPGVAVGVLGLSFGAPLFSDVRKRATNTNTKIFSSNSVTSPSTRHRSSGKGHTIITVCSLSESDETPSKRKRPLRIPILSYQDKYVIISKPSGMTMHHNSNTRWGRSKGPVVEQTIQKQLSRKPYLVHRLDHRTSGAAILGFDSKTAGELHGRLRGDDATKLYVALVRGDLRDRFRCAAGYADAHDVDMSIDGDGDGDGSIIGSRGRIPAISSVTATDEINTTTPPHENASSEYNGRITVNLPIKVDEIEKEAQTDFYFLSSMGLEDEDDIANKEPNYNNNATTTNNPRVTKSLTLLLCHPRTGRRHQIRRHVRSALQAPIIGDSEHGDSRVNRFWRTVIGLDRMALHCWYLGLPPTNDGDLEDDGIFGLAPLTTDLTDALKHEALGPLWEEATRVEPRLKMEPYDERGGSFGRDYTNKK